MSASCKSNISWSGNVYIRGIPTTPTYKERNIIGRFFNKLKQLRRAATRYDKLLANFMGFVKLAATRHLAQIVKCSPRPKLTSRRYCWVADGGPNEKGRPKAASLDIEEVVLRRRRRRSCARCDSLRSRGRRTQPSSSARSRFRGRRQPQATVRNFRHRPGLGSAPRW
jgi:hypothetical protein